MIVLECEQGSAEWEQARLGVATASNCSKIITPTGRLSAARAEYVGTLLAEWCLGEPVEEFMGTYHTERGQTLEPSRTRALQVPDRAPGPEGRLRLPGRGPAGRVLPRWLGR